MSRAWWWWCLAAVACSEPAPPRAPDAVAPLSPQSLPAPVAGGPAATVELGGVPAATLPDIAERVTRSVVSLSVRRPGTARGPEFYDVPQHGRVPDGVGSGVIVRADGVVLSNHHVVDGATAIEVALSDGRVLAATVVGSDRNTDVAVLQLVDPPADLSPIDLGESETLRLGEVVLAVGNPFGVGQTVTMGIVSALGRTGLGLAEYEDFIQTDAAINPGNSGGALVDLRGRLVGVNSAIRSESGGSEGIGFAIPIDRVRRVAERLLATGRADRGFLGVSMRPADAGGAAPLGVVVTNVMPGSPASDAGFQVDDLIVELDGKVVRDLHRFRYEVATSGPGHPFEVVVVRGSERVPLRGAYGALPGAPTASDAPAGSVGGVVLVPLDDGNRAAAGIAEGIEGLLVTEVAPGALADAGVVVGDLVLRVEGAVVTDPAAFAAQWEQSRGGQLVLRLLRAGDLRIVAVTVM